MLRSFLCFAVKEKRVRSERKRGRRKWPAHARPRPHWLRQKGGKEVDSERSWRGEGRRKLCFIS